MLPKEIFDQRKSKTRNPKRKFAAREYLMEVGRKTKVTDLKTQKIMDLDRVIDKFGTIDVQLLDFAGSIFLDTKDWEIQSGFNRLFTTNEITNDSILLEHKLKLSRYMRGFQHKEAMAELEQILKFGEASLDKFTEFRYSCLNGRILTRWGELGAGKQEFEKAFTLLETKFSDEEKNTLIVERKYRFRGDFEEPNWDSVILDYDEIFLISLFGVVLYHAGSYTDPPLISIITRGLELASNYDSRYDKVNLYQTRADIQTKLHKYDEAVADIKKAINIMETNLNFEASFELYSDLTLSLLTALGGSMKFREAGDVIERYSSLFDKAKKQSHGMLNIFQIDINLKKGDISECFKFLEKFKNYYQKHPDGVIYVPQGIARYLFLYLLQGIYLKKITTVSQINSTLGMLNPDSSNEKIITVYRELATIELHLSKKEKIQFQEYKELVSRFSILLSTYEQKDWRYFMIVSHFLRFVGAQIERISDAKSDFHQMLVDFIPSLMNSPYILLAIKIEVINKILQNDLTNFDDWFKKLLSHYQSPLVENLINKIGNYLSTEVNILEFIGDILQDDVYSIHFENVQEIPIYIKLN